MKSTLKDGGGKNLLFESTIFTGSAFLVKFAKGHGNIYMHTSLLADSLIKRGGALMK